MSLPLVARFRVCPDEMSECWKRNSWLEGKSNATNFPTIPFVQGLAPSLA